MNFKNLLPIASNELVFELLEQNSLLPNNFGENNNPERKEVDPNSPEQKEVIKQTSEKLTTLESNINSENNKKDIRLLRKAYRDYYKDGEFDRSKLENFLGENIKKYLSDDLQVNGKQATDQDRLMLFMGDSNFSGSVESMVDNENYKRQTKFGRKVFGEYKKGALGRETERRDSGIVGGDQIVDMMRSIFADTPDKDKSNIYFNLWTEFSKYANITENISVSDSKSFIKPFADKPELYIKFREFLNTFALQLADMISVGAQDTLKQLSEDYERINLSIKEIETETKNILDKNPNIKNNVQKGLENKSDDIVKKQLELNKKLESLPDNQKGYLLYLEGRNSDFDHSTITPTEKQAVDQLFSQKNSLIEERAMVNKVKSDSKLLNQFVTQELSMGLHYLSIIDDGKLIPLSSEDGKNQGKARLQAISAGYGVNYKLGEDGRSFRTGSGAARVPGDNILTPSIYAGLGKTFTVGRGQFISLGLITSGWINGGSWGAGAGLGVGGSHQLNNRRLDKDLDEYVSKSLNRGVGAYMDLSKAFSYGATIGAKFDKESGINQKIPILAEGFANIFDGLLKDFDPSKPLEDNKKLIKEKIVGSFDKTKDNKKLDLFVDQVYGVASVVGNSLNGTDKDYSRKQISAKLSHMFANGVGETEYKKLSKISIDGFNINVAAIALGFANPLMFLLSVTPSIKVRGKNFYIEDQQTKNRAEEDKNEFIGAKEIQDKQSLLDKINGVLGPKDKVELSDNKKTISIPAELLDREDLAISVNSQYKTLLESHTKFEDGKWIVPSWMGTTFYNQFESRGTTKHEIMFFGNKKDAGQKFEVVNKETIQKFSGDPSVGIPQEYMSYTKESIKRGFEELDNKTSVKLSDYFDIKYEDNKISFLNKKSLTLEGKQTVVGPFDPKGTIVFEKSTTKSQPGMGFVMEQITITQPDKEGLLSFEFIDKDLDGTKLNFEKPTLNGAYENNFNQNDAFKNKDGNIDYAKFRDLKYDRVSTLPAGFIIPKGEKDLYTNSSSISKQTIWYKKIGDYYYKFSGMRSLTEVMKDKYPGKTYGKLSLNEKNKALGDRWSNAKLGRSEAFQKFTTALGKGDYETASTNANNILRSKVNYVFTADQKNELHDFNLKVIGERAGETITDTEIHYNKDPQSIINGRTDRFENKWAAITGMNPRLVNRAVPPMDGNNYKISQGGGVGVVLGYEDNFDNNGVDNSNPKYVVGPRYIEGTKQPITDSVVIKNALNKFFMSEDGNNSNSWIKDQTISNIETELNIKFNDNMKKELPTMLSEGVIKDNTGKEYMVKPNISFAFYPDCLNESLLIDFEIRNKTNAQVGKESDVDDNYSNNSTVTNVVANARAYVRPTVSGSVMQAPDSKTNPDVVDSETNPDISSIDYPNNETPNVFDISYKDGTVLKYTGTEDGSPATWNYIGADGISISKFDGVSITGLDITNLPQVVQDNIAGINILVPTIIPGQTTTNIGSIPQSIALGVDVNYMQLQKILTSQNTPISGTKDDKKEDKVDFKNNKQ